jgi:predicted Zn-dependent protease
MKAWAAAVVLAVTAAGSAHAQSLTDDPAFALYRQAVQAAEAKDYVRASQLAKEAIAQYPDHLLAWYLLGQSAMGRSAWDEAADAFGNVVKRYPASFAGHAAFEKALALRPDSQDVRLRLAFMLYEKGQKDAALSHLEKLAGANSTAPEVWLLLARTYYERNDLAASEKAFTRSAGLRDDGKTWFNLGVVRLRLNNPSGARDAFKRASEHNEVREQAMRELDKLDPTKLGTK